MYIEIILLVGISMIVTLLFNMIPKETELRKLWNLFLVVFVVLTAVTLTFYFIFDTLFPVVG